MRSVPRVGGSRANGTARRVRGRGGRDAAVPAAAAGGAPTAIGSDQARTLGGAVLVGLGAGFLAAVMLLRRR